MTHSRTFDDYKHEIMRLTWIHQHRHWTIDKLETRCWLMDVSGCGYNLVNHGLRLSNWWRLCNVIGRGVCLCHDLKFLINLQTILIDDKNSLRLLKPFQGL
ncbi:hypothetical protein NPIL_67781 [Nephila pilipes]|uniref:Uncharacterized protein n=1 Tax=Nephila pilipes TaxID=299642 RepID=A0A8X6N0T8_NEPPI|nr:hypothetical protein NPIL_582521 [Nephila pilipes]GFS87892.1 hypothetical protein NPIL_590051 [Nephila pilipes]GFU11471.1 hypothetical protein NPIL_138071 [Nephila pilipes]GFU33976.1 hypothetical protein NPIL_67781 [Nephila pilipes]